MLNDTPTTVTLRFVVATKAGAATIQPAPMPRTEAIRLTQALMDQVRLLNTNVIQLTLSDAGLNFAAWQEQHPWMPPEKEGGV